MSSRLQAKYAPAFSRDLKRKASKRKWNLEELEKVIDLILKNDAESLETLKQRHNMHRLSGEWHGSNECHVANAGDWLVIWCVNGGIAYFSVPAPMMSSSAEPLLSTWHFKRRQSWLRAH